jgi:hypothetical protein
MGCVCAAVVGVLACAEEPKGPAAVGGSAGVTNAGVGGTAGRGGDGGVAGRPMGGTAGVAGSSGSGGTGGVVPPDFAKCLEDLYAACPLTAPCVRDGDASGPFVECYEDGSRVESALGESPCPGGPRDSITRVYGRDGMLCHSFRSSAGLGCESPTRTWYDAAGTVVASSSGPYFALVEQRYSFRCAGGDWYQFPEPPVLPVPTRPSCSAGVCPGGEGGASGASGEGGQSGEAGGR